MKKAVFVFALFVLLGLSIVPARAGDASQTKAAVAPKIITVEEVRPGMKGVAYTVFQGTQPEPMDVEVLGVLRNMMGPKSDLVLVRLHGEKPEYTGVVAGMSGSPVYIDGKLLGALSYRIGSFSKEPIAGVTPIAQMLEINELDKSIPSPESLSSRKPAGAEKTSTPGASDTSALGYAQYLQPIDAPFVFNGFSESALKQFGPQLSAAGIVPVMGVGSASHEK